MASWLDTFLSDGNWIAPVLLAGATVYGASTSAAANDRAAQIAQQGAQQRAAAIQQSNALAQQRFTNAQAVAAPAVEREKQIMYQGDTLTPAQQTQISDARRVATNQLALSPLRGSGRATVAAIRKTEGDLTNQLTTQNRARADAATSSLNQQYFGANTQAANLDVASGQAIGNAANDVGQIGADQTTSDAQLQGKAIGDIASIVNGAYKDARRSNYSNGQAKQPGETTTLAGGT